MAINPDNVSIFSQFMLDLQTSAQAVPGIVSNQVIIGTLEFFHCDDFYQDVADKGYYVIIGMPSGEASFFNYNGTFEVTVEVFYPIPADLSFNWITVNEQLATLIGGWSHWTAPGGSQWVKGQNRVPGKMSWGKPERRFYEKPCGEFLDQRSFICTSSFKFTMPFISDQVQNPIEVPVVS